MARMRQALARRTRALGRYKQGASVEQIAAELRCSEQSVRRYLGLNNAPGRTVEWPKERLIEALRRFYDEVGRAPTMLDFAPTMEPNSLYFFKRMERKERLGLPSPTTVTNRFGSWNAGLEAAGLPTRSSGSTRESMAELRLLP